MTSPPGVAVTETASPPSVHNPSGSHSGGSGQLWRQWAPETCRTPRQRQTATPVVFSSDDTSHHGDGGGETPTAAKPHLLLVSDASSPSPPPVMLGGGHFLPLSEERRRRGAKQRPSSSSWRLYWRQQQRRWRTWEQQRSSKNAMRLRTNGGDEGWTRSGHGGEVTGDSSAACPSPVRSSAPSPPFCF